MKKYEYLARLPLSLKKQLNGTTNSSTVTRKKAYCQNFKESKPFDQRLTMLLEPTSGTGSETPLKT
jgi:hypothetical protein